MTAILLVAAEAYRSALLGPGPCGAQPPVVTRCFGGGLSNTREGQILAGPSKDHQCYGGPVGTTDALVLSWEGVAVPAGMDHASRVLAKALGVTVGATAPRWRKFDGHWTLGDGSARQFLDLDHLTDPAQALAAACASCGLGTVEVVGG